MTPRLSEFVKVFISYIEKGMFSYLLPKIFHLEQAPKQHSVRLSTFCFITNESDLIPSTTCQVNIPMLIFML